MTTIVQEPTHSNTELLQSNNDWKAERDELLLKQAQERQRNSDLQRHCNTLEQAALEHAAWVATRDDVDLELARFMWLAAAHHYAGYEEFEFTEEFEIAELNKAIEQAIELWKSRRDHSNG